MGFRLVRYAAFSLIALCLWTQQAGADQIDAAQSSAARVAGDLQTENPQKTALGRRLFYEPALSLDGSLSCGSCHIQARSFAGPPTTPLGIDNNLIERQPMALINLGAADTYGWSDDSLDTLAKQMHKPLFGEAPVEMGAGRDRDGVLRRLFAMGDYSEAFRAVYGDTPVSWKLVVDAIVAFQLTLVSRDTGFDRWWRDGVQPSAAAKRGFYLFTSDRLGCASCHAGLQFRVEGYVNNGINLASDKADFKVPTLRNIAVTAPYMHAGQLGSLSEVLDHYAAGPTADLPAFTLSERERVDLLSFFELLTDQTFLSNPAYSPVSDSVVTFPD